MESVFWQESRQGSVCWKIKSAHLFLLRDSAADTANHKTHTILWGQQFCIPPLCDYTATEQLWGRERVKETNFRWGAVWEAPTNAKCGCCCSFVLVGWNWARWPIVCHTLSLCSRKCQVKSNTCSVEGEQWSSLRHAGWYLLTSWSMVVPPATLQVSRNKFPCLSLLTKSFPTWWSDTHAKWRFSLNELLWRFLDGTMWERSFGSCPESVQKWRKVHEICAQHQTLFCHHLLWWVCWLCGRELLFNISFGVISRARTGFVPDEDILRDRRMWKDWFAGGINFAWPQLDTRGLLYTWDVACRIFWRKLANVVTMFWRFVTGLRNQNLNLSFFCDRIRSPAPPTSAWSGPCVV